MPALLGRLVVGAYGIHLTMRQRGASNRRAKSQLGWSPRLRSWREGFQAAG